MEQTANKVISYIIEVTTGKPASANALTPTHTHTHNTHRQRDGTSAKSTRAFHEVEAASQDYGNNEDMRIALVTI